MNADKVERLYRKYAKVMLRAAHSATDDPQLAEDAVQQTFEKLLRMEDRIKEEEEKMTGGLLILMTKQAVSDLYEKKTKAVGLQTVDDENTPEAVDEMGDILGLIFQKDFVQNLTKSLGWLKEKYSVPIIMRYGYEMDNDEIARLLNIDKGKLCVRIHRGMKKIREHLEKGGGL